MMLWLLKWNSGDNLSKLAKFSVYQGMLSRYGRKLGEASWTGWRYASKWDWFDARRFRETQQDLSKRHFWAKRCVNERSVKTRYIRNSSLPVAFTSCFMYRTFALEGAPEWHRRQQRGRHKSAYLINEKQWFLQALYAHSRCLLYLSQLAYWLLIISAPLLFVREKCRGLWHGREPPVSDNRVRSCV